MPRCRSIWFNSASNAAFAAAILTSFICSVTSVIRVARSCSSAIIRLLCSMLLLISCSSNWRWLISPVESDFKSDSLRSLNSLSIESRRTVKDCSMSRPTLSAIAASLSAAMRLTSSSMERNCSSCSFCVRSRCRNSSLRWSSNAPPIAAVSTSINWASVISAGKAFGICPTNAAPVSPGAGLPVCWLTLARNTSRRSAFFWSASTRRFSRASSLPSNVFSSPSCKSRIDLFIS